MTCECNGCNGTHFLYGIVFGCDCDNCEIKAAHLTRFKKLHKASYALNHEEAYSEQIAQYYFVLHRGHMEIRIYASI